MSSNTLLVRSHHTQALQDSEYIYVVLPFCTGGELFSVVSARRGLSEDIARPIFRGLLTGMAFLHNLQICHRYMTRTTYCLKVEG